MSVTGVCQLCESARAKFACDRCGRVVCPNHYDRGSGLCTECAAQSGLGEKQQRDTGARRGDRDDWGEPR